MREEAVLLSILIIFSGCINLSSDKDVGKDITSKVKDVICLENYSETPDKVVGMMGYSFEGENHSLEVEEGSVVEFRNLEFRHSVTFANHSIDRRLFGNDSLFIRFNNCSDYHIYSRYQSPGPGRGMHMKVKVVPRNGY